MDSIPTGWNVCAECGEVLDTSDELLLHFCDEQADGGMLEKTAKLSTAATSTVLQCPKCPQLPTFAHKVALFAHLASCHEVQSVFECSRCDEIFLSRSALSRHLNVHSDSANRLKSPGEFHCDQCPRDFASLTALRRHQAWHAGPLNCLECGNTFRSPVNLKYHDCIKRPNKATRNQFDCFKCAKSFPFQSYLDRHLSTHSDTPIRCSLCQLTFTVESVYLRHCANVHQSDRHKFRCPECNRTFAYRSLLDRHMISHSKEKNFECPDCLSRFSLPHGLLNHREKCHPNGPVRKTKKSHRQWSCAFCQSSFTLESLLERHHMAEHSHLQQPVNEATLAALAEDNNQPVEQKQT